MTENPAVTAWDNGKSPPKVSFLNAICVALAEYVAGSEEIFVERMNERAAELGMKDTHFVNTNGLPVADHYSSAYDIGLMSKELYKHE